MTYFYVLVHLIDSFMSKNEIFSWGFKGGYQPTKKKKKCLTTTASVNTGTQTTYTFNIQNPTLKFTGEVSRGGRRGEKIRQPCSSIQLC